jgi:hypothetical protein
MGIECIWEWIPPFHIWIDCNVIDCSVIICEGKDCIPNKDCQKDDKKCNPHSCKGPDCHH